MWPQTLPRCAGKCQCNYRRYHNVGCEFRPIIRSYSAFAPFPDRYTEYGLYLFVRTDCNSTAGVKSDIPPSRNPCRRGNTLTRWNYHRVPTIFPVVPVPPEFPSDFGVTPKPEAQNGPSRILRYPEFRDPASAILAAVRVLRSGQTGDVGSGVARRNLGNVDDL